MVEMLKEKVGEEIVRALVDELGLNRALEILDRAEERYEIQYPENRSVDFLGMASYAKKYSESVQIKIKKEGSVH